MKTYAHVQNGSVIEIIEPYIDPSGNEVPIEERYIAEFVAQMVDITDVSPKPEQRWTYDGATFSAPIVTPPNAEELAAAARVEREKQLRGIYDPGINMALRSLRMASTPEEQSYAEGKVIELDNYAQSLEDIPDQPGFPQTIVWPIAPTK